MIQLTRQPLLLYALEGAIDMIGVVDNRLPFPRKAGNDARQKYLLWGQERTLFTVPFYVGLARKRTSQRLGCRADL